MTKKELQKIEEFLIEKENSNDCIEVLESAWNWLRTKYHTEGKIKLSTYNKNL